MTRRDFLATTALGCVSTLGAAQFACFGAANPTGCPIAVFSKVYQTLKLSFDDAASLTAEAGLQGVDCPVRPGGEVLPERVKDDLPRYAEALRKHKLGMPLIVSGITSTKSAHAEDVLRAAKKLGIQYYRLGVRNPDNANPLSGQVREYKAQLKDLTAMNRDLGITGLFQNHSPSGKTTYLGGDLAQLHELVADLDPASMGVAFDIAHALVVHGYDWRKHYEKLKPWIRIIYVKDVTRSKQWTPLGKGDTQQTGYYDLVRQSGYQAPISLHIEYDWDEGGKARTRERLLKALQSDLAVLKSWLKL
jgi:sugar phosphate isomerase/epimerase